MSTEPYRKVFWVVLDGAGFEQVSRAIPSGRLPAFSLISSAGHLGPSRPSSPVCQTPPALLTLFTGAEPAAHGVWGYHQPDYHGSLLKQVSGFSAQPYTVPEPGRAAGTTNPAGSTIWEDLDAAGVGSAIMNVAFRRDRVWTGTLPHVSFAHDVYRLSRGSRQYRLPKGRSLHHFRGIEFSAVRDDSGVTIRKSGRVAARLREGDTTEVSLTRGARSFGHLMDAGTLRLHAISPAGLRISDQGRAAGASGRGFDWSAEMDCFRAARRAVERDPRSVGVGSVLSPCRESLSIKAEAMLWAVRNMPARLFACYLPVVDELNHAFFDLLESREREAGPAAQAVPAGSISSPGQFAAELMLSTLGMVDDFLGRLMGEAGEDTLVVVCSDHGAMANRRVLAVNEVLAAAGLVTRGRGGYDLARSPLFYHPSGCGQVLLNPPAARRSGLDAPAAARLARQAIERGNAEWGSDIACLDGGPMDPFLLFLYPRSDTHISSGPPRSPRTGPVWKRGGGHHLSPLSPTRWMQALCGAWSPRGTAGLEEIPAANAGLKGYVLRSLGLA